MALGLKLWVGAVVASCGLVALALLPAREDSQDWDRWYETVGADSFYIDLDSNPQYRALARHRGNVERSLEGARDYLNLLEMRDSLHAAGSVDEAGQSGVGVLTRGESPSWMRGLFRSLLDLEADYLRMLHYPTVVVVTTQVSDSGSLWSGPYGWWSQLNYLIPGADDRVCLSLVEVDVGQKDSREYLENYLPRALDRSNVSLMGPCAYFMAFGAPGEYVGRWLEESEYSHALMPGWLGERPRISRRTRYTPGYLAYRVARMRDDFVPAVACAGGDSAACRRALYSPPVLNRWWYWNDFGEAERPAGVIRRDRLRGWAYYPLGPRQPSYLSDLLIDQGHNRFRRFWTSDAELEEAFQQAFGMPIEQWTMQWARSQIGIPRRGPSAPAGSVVMSLVLGVVFVGAGAAYATRREVS